MADTKDSLLNTYREQNEVLRKSNQDMQDRIGQLQKENASVSSEKKNLLEKIKQLGNYHSVIPLMMMITLICSETEVVRSPCKCEDYEKLLGEFRDLQTKHCKLDKIMKLREQELEILKSQTPPDDTV